jgi:hypothetical protein
MNWKRSCHSCSKCDIDSSQEIVFCVCKSCEKEKFPCEHFKLLCNCKLCKKIPDIEAIPRELNIFQRVVVSQGNQISPLYRSLGGGFKVDFEPKYLRKGIYGACALATHFAQERFSEEYLKNLNSPNKLEKNLHSWNQHKEITKSVHEFQKKYHRFPPCFRERMDIRNISKVSFLQNYEFKTFHSSFSQVFFRSNTNINARS